MELCYTILSETGLGRKENEDAVFGANYGSVGIFLVADGMGGHSNGARASATIRENVKSWWTQYLKNIKKKEKADFFQNIEEIKAILEKSNQEILEYTKEGEICGSTAVLLWIQEDAWAVFSCGDSRCYQIRESFWNKRVCQLTTDDVWENQQQNIRGLNKAEIREHQNFGYLVRAVGTNPNFSCTVRSDRIENKTVFALCSDGIYRYCPERYLKKQMYKARKAEDLKTCMNQIKSEVYQNGAPDNLSLIFVHITT